MITCSTLQYGKCWRTGDLNYQNLELNIKQKILSTYSLYPLVVRAIRPLSISISINGLIIKEQLNVKYNKDMQIHLTFEISEPIISGLVERD